MKKLFSVLLLVFLSFSTIGCGSSSEPQIVTVTQRDAGTTVSLQKNQLLKVALQGNGTTGYSWEVVPGAETILTQQGALQFVADSTGTGSGGTFTYSFKVSSLGTTSLTMNYQRPFEPGVAPLETFQITVVANE